MRGVITDWGGVLTTPILTTIQAWIQADSIDWDSYRTVMRSWVFDAYGPDASQNPVHALERGECSGAEFEQMLAARLLRTDGGVVTAQGILRRMFAASTAYCERWASSVMTMTSDRSESFGNVSPCAVPNF